MREAVITQVIAERTFGERATWSNDSTNAEVGIGIDGQVVAARRLSFRERNTMPGERSGEC